MSIIDRKAESVLPLEAKFYEFEAGSLPVSLAAPKTLEANPTDKNSTGWRRYIGIVFILLSCMTLSFMAFLVKLLKGYHPFTLTVWRYAGNVVPSIPVLLYLHYWRRERVLESVWPLCKAQSTENRKNVLGVLLRGLLGGLVTICRFSALKYLSLADVAVIVQATPAFVFVLARLFLGEKFSVVAGLSAVLSILGIGVFCRPPLLTGAAAFDTSTLIGLALAIEALLCSSSTLIISRRLRKLNFALLIFGYGLVGIFEALVLSFSFGVFRFPEGARDFFLTVLLSVLTFLGQVFSVLAIKYETAGIISVLKSSYVLYSFGWEMVFLHVFPDYITITGAIMVLSAIVLTALRKWILTMPEGSHTRRKLFFLTK